MNDSFKARILAELDLSKIPNDIKKIEKQEVTLRNITLDTSSLPKTIQGSLDKHKFQINLDGIKMNNIDSQMRTAGSKAGQSFSDGLVKTAFNDYMRKLREINSIESNLFKLDGSKNKTEIETLNRQLSQLKQELADIDRQFSSSFSDAQIASIINTMEKAERQADDLASAAHDVKVALSQKIDSGLLDIEFSKVKAEFESLKSATPLITAQVNELENAFNGLKGAGDIDDKLEAYKRFNSLLPVTKKNVESLAKAEKEAAKASAEAAKAAKEVVNNHILLSKKSTLSNNIESWMKTNKKAAEAYRDELDLLIDKLKDDNLDGNGLRQVTAEFNEIKSKAKAAGLSVNSFGQELKKSVLMMAGIDSVYEVLQKIVQLFKAMYQEVYAVDTAMTNLYKVTDAPPAKYEQFLDNSAQKAKALGRTVSDVIEQSAEWAKLGYSIDDSAQLAELSSIYANVAEIDNSTAVSDMVTASKAFNITTENAVRIVDTYNDLGNKFAVTAAGIGDGITKSASALNLAGVEFEQAAAMITGGAEITQNASEFGNALKVSSMRIRGFALSPPLRKHWFTSFKKCDITTI